MKLTSSAGKKRDRRVTIYALSTCGWCRRTKEMLDAADIGYDYIDVDKTSGPERDECVARVRQLNPRGSYPTIEIDNEVIAGFDEDRIRELLGI